MNKATTTLFAQLVGMMPRSILEGIAAQFYKPGNASKFTVWDQLVALVFCHIGGCDSLREIEDGLYSALGSLNHAGGAQALKRTSLAYANARRDYRIFEQFYFKLLEHYADLFNLRFSSKYDKPVYAIDSTTITLCMKLFPWAKYTSTKGGIKLHTALDLQLALPVVMNMTNAKVHDSKATREIIDSLPPFSVVVMDRGYNDYSLFHELNLRGTTFVTRIKDNAKTSKLVPVKEQKDRWGVYRMEFVSERAKEVCGGEVFHLVQWYDEENDRWFDFLTNDLTLEAEEVAELYRSRWEIELFFKKLKQNLLVKSFIGTNENAVMSQIWTAAIVTLLTEVLRLRSTFEWHYSRLFKFLRLNLLTYKDLAEWIHRPDIPDRGPRPKKPPMGVQETLF